MSLIYPVLVQIGLTFAVLGWLGLARYRAAIAREVDINAVALSNESWPLRIRQIGNNLQNQFETPVLFYALVLIALHIGAIGLWMVLFAWGYVATRIVHTIIHTGSNAVPMRFRVFVLGIAMLIAMWVGILVKVVPQI